LALSTAQLAKWLTIQKLAIVGDDCLAALPLQRADGRRWDDAATVELRGHLADFGFIAEIGSSERLIDCVFLGQRPYPVGGRWYWGPTIGRRCYKHHASIGLGVNPINWLRGIAEMERDHLGFVPIIGAMGRRVMELTQGPINRQLDPYAVQWRERLAPLNPQEDTYRAVAELYGVTPTAIRALEEQIAGTMSLPCILDGPVVEAILSVDAL
jgi:hypothetical protein